MKRTILLFLLLFSFSLAEDIDLYVVPTITNDFILSDTGIPSEYLSDEISISACSGEFKPATFVVRANEDIEDLQVSASSLTGPGTIKQAGLDLIAESINYVLGFCSDFNIRLLLETTAGQGTSLGYNFEQLKKIIEQVEQTEKVGVCLDTCHIFTAGYDIRTQSSYEATFEQFDRVIGFDRLTAIHLNDSKKKFGSRLDRHEQ
ncbi:deoxyribonuclease IV, partial [archaeon]|nr:deoxyribonuclease IV [archaeon]